MSNKVYGFCDAGCKYRVPTYEEFENSASIIKVAPDNLGVYHLEVGKKYRIRSLMTSGWGALSISMNWQSPAETDYYGTISVTLPEEKDFVNELTFCVLGTTQNIYTLCDGTYKEWETGTSEFISELEVTVKKAAAVYLVNEDATINIEVTGKDGYTPVKGTDYFTEEDKAEIVQAVIETLGGEPIFGYVDEDNNIVLSGNLADSTYTVKYEMEDGSTVDIGTLDTNTYYSITNNLTNCANDNGATEAVEGKSYSATISAYSGYALSSLVVTMGGTDVTSSAVSGGNIDIANVTGDIVITAVAELTEVRTNFCVVDTSVTTAPDPSDGTVGYANTNPDSPSYGWISGGRCSSSGADRLDSATTCVTNYIPVQNGDILYVKNLDISTSVYSGMYKSDYSAIAGFTMTSAASAYVKDINLSGEWEQFTINNANAGFIRICGSPSIVKDAAGAGFWGKYDVTELDIIVNIKRDGEWL